MKLRWLAILCALSVSLPACDSKKKDKSHNDDDDEDDRPRKKSSSSASTSASAGSNASAAKPATSASAVVLADDDPPPPPAPTELPKAPMTPEQVQAFLKDDSARMSPEVFETLLLGLAECSLDRSGIDYRCPARKTFSDAQKHKNEDYKKTAQIALKHLRHPKPSVRYQAVSSSAADAAFGSSASDDGPTLYIDALRTESDPAVLANMVQAMYSGAKKSAKVRKVIVRLLDHSESRVREAAARRIGDKEVAKEIPNAFDLLKAKVEKDTDDRVRAEACAGLAATENEDAIAIFEKFITTSGTPKELVGGCFEGATEMWVGIPYPKKPSKAAYELTMKVLEKPDRSQEAPPWRGISKLGYAKTEFKDYDRDGKDWSAAAKAFYDKARLVKALQAIALDEKADMLARSSCLSDLKQLGESKILETIAPTIKGQKGYPAKSLSEQAEKLAKEKVY